MFERVVGRVEAHLAERRQLRDVRGEGDAPLARSQRRKPDELGLGLGLGRVS